MFILNSAAAAAVVIIIIINNNNNNKNEICRTFRCANSYAGVGVVVPLPGIPTQTADQTTHRSSRTRTRKTQF